MFSSDVACAEVVAVAMVEVAPQQEAQVPLESLTVAELKVLLRARGMRVSGRKLELIERLREASVTAP
jgi:hypothetical protein